MEAKQIVAKNILSLRKGKFSQLKLSCNANITAGMLSNIERGRANPKFIPFPK